MLVSIGKSIIDRVGHTDIIPTPVASSPDLFFGC